MMPARRPSSPAGVEAVDDPVVRRVAARLAEQGASWPVFAAWLLSARGRRALTRAEAASLLGLDDEGLAELEDGLRHPGLAPALLGTVYAGIEWRALAADALQATPMARCPAGSLGAQLRTANHPSARPGGLVRAPRAPLS